jgi:cytochrome c oxidase subunit 3
MAISLNNKIEQPLQGSVGLHPKKFMMLIGMVSMTMMFVALTSALLVKKGDTVKWESFSIPSIFLYSTIAIILSSATIQWSLNFYKKGQDQYKFLLFATFLLGVIFTALQYYGWIQIKELGFPLSGNVSGSFVYIITGFHLAHLIAGMLALFITLLLSIIKRNPIDELKRIADINKKVNYEILVMFWHFLGVLWIYLYSFLYIVYNT